MAIKENTEKTIRYPRAKTNDQKTEKKLIEYKLNSQSALDQSHRRYKKYMNMI